MTCPYCHVLVAPFDPEKVNWNGQDFHRNCHRKAKKQSQLFAKQKLNAHVGQLHLNWWTA